VNRLARWLVRLALWGPAVAAVVRGLGREPWRGIGGR
jgi:hypothetical protein